jgi:hypothetical protein
MLSASSPHRCDHWSCCRRSIIVHFPKWQPLMAPSHARAVLRRSGASGHPTAGEVGQLPLYVIDAWLSLEPGWNQQTQEHLGHEVSACSASLRKNRKQRADAIKK